MKPRVIRARGVWILAENVTRHRSGVVSFVPLLEAHTIRELSRRVALERGGLLRAFRGIAPFFA